MNPRINHFFFRCVYRFVISLNTRNTFWFSNVDHLMSHVTFLALLHILCTNLLAKYFLQCPESPQFLWVLYPTGLAYTKTFIPLRVGGKCWIYPPLLYSWSLFESNAHSYWLIYGHMATLNLNVTRRATIKQLFPALPLTRCFTLTSFCH